MERRWSTGGQRPSAKVPVIIGASNGAGSKHVRTVLFAASVVHVAEFTAFRMGGEQAAGVLLTVKLQQLKDRGQTMSADEQKAFMAPTLAKYEEEGSPYYSTARLWDDGILDPCQTRDVLGLSIAMSLNAPIAEHKVGVFRM